eukprot:4255389-Karenia_brevis.AAC.1
MEQCGPGNRPEEYYIAEGTEAEGNQQGGGGSTTPSVQCSPRVEDPEPMPELMFTIEEPGMKGKDTCPICETRKGT